MTLQERIEGFATEAHSSKLGTGVYGIFEEFLLELEAGKVRAAIRDDTGSWTAVPWVKRGILLGFRIGAIVDMSVPAAPEKRRLSFVDKHTFPPRQFTESDGVRIVPGGSSVRRGAYLAKGVVCMPPM